MMPQTQLTHLQYNSYFCVIVKCSVLRHSLFGVDTLLLIHNYGLRIRQ